jgi:hypothetical protein
MRLPASAPSSYTGGPGPGPGTPGEAGTARLPTSGPAFSGGVPGYPGPSASTPGPPERRRGRTALVIAVVAAVLIALVAGIAAMAASGGDGKDDKVAAPPPSANRSRHPSKRRTPSPSRTPSRKPAVAKAAKPNPYTPQRVCGSGYRVIDMHGLGDATTYLLYNTHAGANCVVTMIRKSSGKTFLSASLVVKGGARGSRAGAFPFYAGPVRLAAKGKCVTWGGASKTAKWTSGWSHCGK